MAQEAFIAAIQEAERGREEAQAQLAALKGQVAELTVANASLKKNVQDSEGAMENMAMAQQSMMMAAEEERQGMVDELESLKAELAKR